MRALVSVFFFCIFAEDFRMGVQQVKGQFRCTVMSAVWDRLVAKSGYDSIPGRFKPKFFP
jgi:hypothetical protein